MRSPLFRPEVDPQIPFDAPGPHLQGAGLPALALAAALAVGIGCACLVPVARIERAEGVLLNQASARVTAPRAGVVEEIFAAEGRPVFAKAPIAVLSFEQHTYDGEVGLALEQNLAMQTALLRQQLQVDERRLQTELLAATRRRAALARQSASVQTQIDLQDKKITAAQRRFDALGPLRAQGYVSEPEYRAREAALLADQQTKAALQAERERLNSDQAAASDEAAIARLTAAERMSIRRRELASLQATRTQQEAQSRLVLSAPRSGRLSVLKVRAGQIVQAGELIALVEGDADRTTVAAFVSDKAVRKIAPGMPVRVRFDALPAGKFTPARGVIQGVAASPLAPGDADAANLPRPGYRVIIQITDPARDQRGQAAAAPPGALAQVAVELERSSLLERALRPVVDAIGARTGA